MGRCAEGNQQRHEVEVTSLRPTPGRVPPAPHRWHSACKSRRWPCVQEYPLQGRGTMLTGKVAMTAAAPQGSQVAFVADERVGDRTARPAKRRPRSRHNNRTQNVVPWLYLLVPLALLITFVYVPVFNLFYYSVTDWDGITPNPSLVGISNYKEIFTDSV